MVKPVNVTRDGVEKSIKAVGQDLIDRAKDISNDIKNVNQITILVELNPCEIVTFNVNKEYTATMKE